ncbi:PAS domain S-box protein, partial [bacterium]|nr:PAS domain S-box protein [bacterium]
MTRIRPSLIRRAIVLFIVAIIISAVLTVYLLNYYSEQFLRDISRRNFDLAHHVKEYVKVFLDHHVAELRELKLMIDERGIKEVKIELEEFDHVSAFHPLLEVIQVLDEKGRIVQTAPFNKEYIDLDMSGHKSFRGAIKLKEYDVHWSDSFISPHTNDPAVTISLHLNDGVLMALLNLRELSRTVTSSLPEENVTIVITDRRGVVIAHPNEKMVHQGVSLLNLPSVRKAMEGLPGTYEETWKKEKGLSSVTAIEGSGWVVAVFQEERQALGIIYDARRVVVIAVILLLGINMLIFLILQRQGMKPIRRLEEMADLIAAGRYGEDLDGKYLELSGFVDSFNKMTRAVRSREGALIASEERFRILFDEAAEPVYLMDGQGDLLAANKRACQALGYSPMEFIQMNASHFIVGQDRSIVSKRLAAIGVGEAVTAEGEHQHRDGTVYPVEVRIARMEADGQD